MTMPAEDFYKQTLVGEQSTKCFVSVTSEGSGNLLYSAKGHGVSQVPPGVN